MRSFATILLAAGFAAAQTSTTSAASSTSTCAAQNIVDACLGSTKPQLEACPQTDWDCLCNQANNVLTCYNNCPGHPDQFGAQQTKVSYCNAADTYGSSALSKVSASTAPAGTSTGLATVVSATATPTGNNQQNANVSPTSSGASAAASTGAATHVKVPALVGGGLLAALFF